MLTDEQVLRGFQFEMARQHPRYFLPHLRMPDSRGGEWFQFATLTEEEARTLRLPFHGKTHRVPRGQTARGEQSWLWQRDYVDEVVENHFTITLKARQLGVSWIWDGLIQWDLLFFPGIDDLIYSIKEEDAIEQVNRVWDMWLSIPDWMKEMAGVTVIKPYGSARPSARIEIEHPDGRLSTVTGMPATKKAGHSRSARRVLFDEGAHQDFARDIWKAIMPAVGDGGGTAGIVSTANGISDGIGGGNFFHEVYSGAGGIEYPNVKKIFLPWHMHPGRTQEWYEGMNLSKSAKAEQYPEDDDEAFLLTGSPYFDLESLQYYSRAARVEPEFQAEFVCYSNNMADARLVKKEGAPLDVYERPQPRRRYCIGVDTATGDGADFSVAEVIDLDTAKPVAELRMKADYIEFTRQLHFLGAWYNSALIGVEDQGGWGKVILTYLRDGHEGRKSYMNLYRYKDRAGDRKKKLKAAYGIPMNNAVRNTVVAELGRWINGKLLPWIPRRVNVEARTFVRANTRPSPRAQDGTHDDAVMAFGIALFMYGDRGAWPDDVRKKSKPESFMTRTTDDPRSRR